MTRERLFWNVFIATLCVDLLVTAVYHAGPDGQGRLLICLVAGYAGLRSPGWLRSAAAAFSGVMMATLFTLGVYVLSGQAAHDDYGPGRVLSLVTVTMMIGAIAPLLGAAAALLEQRFSRAPGGLGG